MIVYRDPGCLLLVSQGASLKHTRVGTVPLSPVVGQSDFFTTPGPASRAGLTTVTVGPCQSRYGAFVDPGPQLTRPEDLGLFRVRVCNVFCNSFAR
jgi:hypothetical protein